jgi:hypothetical protein
LFRRMKQRLLADLFKSTARHGRRLCQRRRSKEPERASPGYFAEMNAGAGPAVSTHGNRE